MRARVVFAGSLVACFAVSAIAQRSDCSGSAVLVGNQRVIALAGGGAAVRAKMNVNIDGSGRAYAKTNAAAELAGSAGFYVSPTSLFDPNFAADDQRRYPDPLLVPGGVMRNSESLGALGVKLGTFGVAVDPRRVGAEPVPFIVNDFGPRIGEGSAALARLVAGKAIKPDITRSKRFVGVVDTDSIVWAFFGGDALTPPFGADRVRAEARRAFESWCGAERLRTCVAATAKSQP